MSDRRSTLREVALTIGAALGACCLLVAVLSMGFGIKPLVFRSGSMGPGIPTGALGLARTVPAAELVPGDVVSVIGGDGTRVTHRVVTVEPLGAGAASLTLKGDANEIADAEPYAVSQGDRLFWSAPRLGYAVSALSSRPAAFAGGLLAGVLAMVVVGRREPTGPASGSASPAGSPSPGASPSPAGSPSSVGGSGSARPVPAVRRRRHLPIGRVGLGLVLVVALMSQLHPTRAYAAWSDTGTAPGALTTVTVPAPVVTCSAAVVSVTFRWATVTDASYVLIVRRTNGTVFSTTPIPAGSTSYTAGGLLASGTATLQSVRYTGAWTSVPSNSVAFTLGLSCG